MSYGDPSLNINETDLAAQEAKALEKIGPGCITVSVAAIVISGTLFMVEFFGFVGLLLIALVVALFLAPQIVRDGRGRAFLKRAGQWAFRFAIRMGELLACVWAFIRSVRPLWFLGNLFGSLKPRVKNTPGNSPLISQFAPTLPRAFPRVPWFTIGMLAALGLGLAAFAWAMWQEGREAGLEKSAEQVETAIQARDAARIRGRFHEIQAEIGQEIATQIQAVERSHTRTALIVRDVQEVIEDAPPSSSLDEPLPADVLAEWRGALERLRLEAEPSSRAGDPVGPGQLA